MAANEAELRALMRASLGGDEVAYRTLLSRLSANLCAYSSYSTRYRKAKASKGLTGSFGDRSWPRKAII
jgi:hypothetical protein